MADQKIDNQLNLALEATPEEREKSGELDVGYDPRERTWELIVKYSGDPGQIESESVQVTELLNEYAVLTVQESRIDRLARIPEIEYIEKPKRLYFAAAAGKRASCMTPVQRPPLSLTGRGVLAAVLDSGADYRHPEFLNPDGTTRILALWDQTAEGVPPQGYHIGAEYDGAQINEALQSGALLTEDASGHGTGVLAIAAGNSGVAYESGILAVKLGSPRADGFPSTTELMQGLDYVVRKALAYRMPLAVNISFGNTYGPHTGTSLLETYINDISNFWKSVICVGSGNEGAAAGHTDGRLTEGKIQNREFAVGSYEPGFSLQIWKNYADDFTVSVTDPRGAGTGPLPSGPSVQRYRLGNTELLVYYGEPAPYSVEQEIYMEFIPARGYIDAGIWNVELIPRKILDGVYRMWLPSRSVTGGATRFLRPSESDTLTIPSTAEKVLTAGAYDARTDAYAYFSGRGSSGRGRLKPDLVAPGVDILTAAPDGRYVSRTGTSFAVPFVTGAAALLMQYGIVDGNDLYLYGEKVKAYLRRGAEPLPGFADYPNSSVGYGKLCVENSLPM